MAKHFTSVLKLVETSLHSDNKLQGEIGPPEVSMQVDAEGSKLTLALQADQPHPPNSSKLVTLCFDKVLPADVSGSSLYKQTAKEVVENALLGYHGTVITFSNSMAEREKSESMWGASDGMILRATKQVYRCLRKSKESRSKSSASNLVILCSFVMIAEEEVRDLLCNLDDDNAVDVETTYLPPKLEIVNGRVRGGTQHSLTTSKEVLAILRCGENMKRKILGTYTSSRSTFPLMQMHHTIFTLTVEFNQFGSMNAPVSGNLVFVDLAVADPLAKRQSFMKGDTADRKVMSLFAFANVVEHLSPNMVALDAATSSESAFSQEAERSFLPHVPISENSNPHEGSLLTQLIKNSLGGNCKTLLVTYIPTHTQVNHISELVATLKLASRARTIQNTPNKRDLAEKALMSAYLRGLEEVYGQVREEEGQPKPEKLHILAPVILNKDDEDKGSHGSQHSIASQDIDDAYGEMTDATKGDER